MKAIPQQVHLLGWLIRHLETQDLWLRRGFYDAGAGEYGEANETHDKRAGQHSLNSPYTSECTRYMAESAKTSSRGSNSPLE